MSLPALWPYLLAAVVLFALLVLIVLFLLLRRSAKSSEFVDAEEPQEEKEEEKPESDSRAASTIPAAFRRAAKYIDRAADGDRKNVPLFLLAGDRTSRDADLLAQTGLDLSWGTAEAAETSLGDGRGFWVFDRGVVLDLAGEETEWETIVEQLRRMRPRRPVDGVIVTFSCAEMLEAATSELKRSDLAARAAKTYRTLWDAQQELGFRLPTYVVITGCEQLTGFQSLVASLPAESRQQIVGWSNPNGVDAIFRGTWIDEAFDALTSRLRDVTMEVFAEGTKEGDALVRLPAAAGALAKAMRPAVESLFKSSAYHGTLFFRGLYLCGRETSPIASNEPPSGRIAFLGELLDRKIFAEHRLASPTARTVMARNRTVTIVKSIAAATFVLTLLILGWCAYTFSAENAVLEPVLSEAADDMEGQPTPAELGKNALELLSGMGAISFNRYDSMFVPVSWFHPFQRSLEDAFTAAFSDIIVRALRAELKSKSRSLVPTDPYVAGAVSEASAAMLPGDEAQLPWINDRVVPIAAIPEFVTLRVYADSLHELDEEIAVFNGLQKSGDLRELGRVVRYAFRVELDPSFYRKSHLYRRSLLEASYRPLLPNVVFQQAAANKLTRLTNEFHDALFRRNPFTARLRLLATTVRNITWEPPRNGETQPLQQLADQLKRIDDDLSGPELDWAFKRTFDFGPEYNALLGDLAAISYFHEDPPQRDPRNDVANVVREKTTAWWSRFQQGLAAASTPLTPTILAVQDGRPQKQLSKETLLLRAALQTFLGQSFVSAQRPAVPIQTELREGNRLEWDNAALDQAVAVGEAYDRFGTSTVTLFPAEVRTSIIEVARQRATAEMLDAVARARRELPVEYVDSATEREEQIRLDVTRFNNAVPRLEKVLDATSRLSPEAARLVGGAMNAEAYRILASVDALLEQDRPYATLEDIGHWDGGVPPSPRVWGKGDEADLAAWLEATRGRIAYVAMNYAKPALAWLTKTQAAARPGMRGLVTRWQAIVDDVRDFDAKKPGNSISVLEDYIAVRMAKVTARDCGSGGLPTGFRARSFFGTTALDLSRQVRQRCLSLAGRDMNTRYADVARYFNQRLAGRYPFAEAPPKKSEAEADPDDIRTFFELFDKHKASLLAPASQGGLDPSQEAQRTFIEEISAVRAFFAPFLDAPKPEPAPSFDLEPTFRVLKGSEIDGQQIIAWTVEAGDDAVSSRQASKKLRWTVGQPLRFSLRWAADSPRLPLLDKQPRAALAGDRKVVWEYANRWALLVALADHRVRAEELPGYADALPETLAFDLATKPAAGPASDSTRVRVFMRLALLVPGTSQPVELPSFPRRAPRLESAVIEEAAR